MRFYVHAPTRGVPPLGSVLTPSMTRTYAGWSSRGRVYGQPGTLGIYVPDPAGMRENLNSYANIGTSSTQNAPNVIFPPLYWEADKPLDKEHAPVSRISDDQMPVPAERPPNVIKAAPYRARKGGQRQVFQPQVVQQWRGMKGTPYG